MADNLTAEKRRKVMSSIRSRNTKPELFLWDELDHRIYRRFPNIPGRPDMGNAKRKVAIFVDGCFWHGCPICYKPPTTRVKYWSKKLYRNAENDRKVNEMLALKGFKVLRFWEHQIREDLGGCLKEVSKATS